MRLGSALASVVAILATCACGGPSGPSGPVTEAQVSSNGRWSGTFGERGTVGGGGGIGEPFIIGNGRQCAVAQLLSGTLTTVRVGGSSMTIYPDNPRGTVCGEGLIRSR
jgi:hypothetical protein